MKQHHISVLVPFIALSAASCGGEAAADAARASLANTPQVCEVVANGIRLPADVRETSGLARSARSGDIFWTHNDAGNEPVIFAIGGDGRLHQRVRVTGATLTDWEDIAPGTCAEGSCLYIGDIGDNDANRTDITVYRVAEPAHDAVTSATAIALRARYPDGARDAEGLFVDASGRIHVVTKGRDADIALYRYPAAPNPAEVATLERVRGLLPQPRGNDDRVTAASASPDGRWIAILSYRRLFIYGAADLLAARAVTPLEYDLSNLDEQQGESLVLTDQGDVWTSSEAENRGAQPTLSRLRCPLDAPAGPRP